MKIETQTGLAMVLLALGWLLGRWAAQYDVKSWVSDAVKRGAWHILRRGAWRRPREFSLDEVVSSDPILKQQVSDRLAEVKADAARIGKVRTAAKHGGLYVLAYTVNLLTGPLMLAGILVLAHAAWRWLR
jgi:hypothetical protein